MITITLSPYIDLSADNLYELLAFRNEVFITEQACFYQDLDYNDQQAIHLQQRENHQLIGYARILPYDAMHMSFGRLAIAKSHRRQGLARQLMEIILSYLNEHHPKQAIIITAQCYLNDFYQHYGFIPQGQPFDMDGLEHLKMIKTP